MMRYKNSDERYADLVRGQTRALEAFIRAEREKAEFLLETHRRSGAEMDDAAYRAAAYFVNSEYDRKAGSLALLVRVGELMDKELPSTTKENFIDLLRYRFRVYGLALAEGGF